MQNAQILIKIREIKATIGFPEIEYLCKCSWIGTGR